MKIILALIILQAVFTLTSTWPHKSSPEKRYVIRRGNLSQDNFKSTLINLKLLLERNAKIEHEVLPVSPDEILNLISRPLGVFRDF